MQNLKKMFGAQDMTVGKPLANLAAFSIPLLIGNLAQQMYNTVDSIVVGQYCGDSALAAVGASGPILNLLLLLFMGISTGAGILVSQYFGAHKEKELTKTVGTCLTLTLIASLIIMAVGPFIIEPLMTLLDTPPDVYDMAVDYLMIIVIGIAGSAYYNIVSGVLRGLGDSFTPLVFLIVACLLNIVLDLVFVVSFDMAAAGVALATVIAQAISAVLCIWRLTHMPSVVKVTKASLIPDKRITARTVQLGLPSGLTQAIFSMAAIIVQALTNSFGTSVIACAIVVMRVDGFAMMPNFTFGTAMTTFAGQNIGAGKLDRVEKGTKDCMKIGVTVSVILVAAILIFGKYLMVLFTSTQSVIDTGVLALRILAVGYVAMAVTQILSGVMRGAGDTMTPMWISMITTVVIRVPIAYLLNWILGTYHCLFISLLTSWVLGAVITAVAYRMGNWKKKSILGN